RAWKARRRRCTFTSSSSRWGFESRGWPEGCRSAATSSMRMASPLPRRWPGGGSFDEARDEGTWDPEDGLAGRAFARRPRCARRAAGAGSDVEASARAVQLAPVAAARSARLSRQPCGVGGGRPAPSRLRGLGAPPPHPPASPADPRTDGKPLAAGGGDPWRSRGMTDRTGGRQALAPHDVERVETRLRSFLDETRSRAALLVDRAGHLIAAVGDVGFDTTGFASLAAADFAASSQLARLLGEEEFASMYHRGATGSMLMADVAGRALMAVLFDDRTTLGMV